MPQSRRSIVVLSSRPALMGPRIRARHLARPLMDARDPHLVGDAANGELADDHGPSVLGELHLRRPECDQRMRVRVEEIRAVHDVLAELRRIADRDRVHAYLSLEVDPAHTGCQSGGLAVCAVTNSGFSGTHRSMRAFLIVMRPNGTRVR